MYVCIHVCVLNESALNICSFPQVLAARSGPKMSTEGVLHLQGIKLMHIVTCLLLEIVHSHLYYVFKSRTRGCLT
jgi:hypothetical protein